MSLLKIKPYSVDETQTFTFAGANITGNINSGNANLGNLAIANYFQGNGSLLTSLTGGNVTGQVGNALVAGTVYTAAQPNITSVGTLTSLAVTGNITAGNVDGGNVVKANYFVGNGSLLSGVSADTAHTTANGTSNVDIATADGNITMGVGGVGNVVIVTTSGVNVAGYLTASGNITGGNISGGNLVSANYFSGNGSALSSITGANVTGQVGNALVAGTVYTAAQPNITSVGTLTSLTVSGNVTAGNVAGGNLVSANYFSGNGSALSSITGANVTGEVSFAAVANSVAGANVTGQVGNALVAGTVYTAAQPNITSVGTLTSLAVTGNVTAGNIKTDNLLHANGAVWDFATAAGNAGEVQFSDGTDLTSNVNFTFDPTYGGGALSAPYIRATGGGGLDVYHSANISENLYVVGNVSAGNISATKITGTLTTAAQPNITSVGTLTSLDVTGNVTAGNITTSGSSGNISGANVITANYFVGNGAQLSAITGANVTGTVANATYAVSAGSATTAGTVTTAAQPNITSVGTLTSLDVTGNITGGNISTSGSLTAGDATINGNLVVNGTTTTVNSTVTHVEDPLFELGGGNNGATLTNNDSKDRGIVAHYYNGAAVDAFMGWDNSNAEFAFGSNVSVANDVATFNTFGNVRAANFLGDLTGHATTAGTVTTAAQPNITSVGTLTGVTSTGTVDLTGASNVSLGAIGNLHITGGTNGYVLKTNGSGTLTWTDPTSFSTSASGSNTQVQFNDNGSFGASSSFTFNSATNTLTATNIAGNGSALSSITGGNVTGQVGNALVAGTVYTAAQPNITSTGTLTSLTVSGATNLGAVGNVHVTGGTTGQALTTNGSGNLSWTTLQPTSVVVDTFSGTGSQTMYTLTEAPNDVNYTIVAVGGVFQPRAAYTISDTTLTFTSPPPNGYAVEVTTIIAGTSSVSSYVPTTSSDWAGAAPSTIGQALDRLAAVVKTLNSGTGA